MYGELCLLSLNNRTKNKLIKKGFHKFMDIISIDRDILSKLLKFPDNQTSALIEECNRLLLQQNLELSLQSPQILHLEDEKQNEVLNGGLSSQSIIELIGLPGSGKTFIAMKWAISWATSFNTSKIYYLDTEGSINIRYFKELCSNDTLFSRIFHTRIVCEKQLFNFVRNLTSICKGKGHMLIIDSINFLLKSLNKNDASRAKIILKLGMELLEHAGRENLCVIVVNGFSNNLCPILGETWALCVTKRVYVKDYLVNL